MKGPTANLTGFRRDRVQTAEKATTVAPTIQVPEEIEQPTPGTGTGTGGSVFELYDSPTPPFGAPFPYLRFERDMDGDVQSIFLGTAT